jgi:bacterioferritin-associated ferredoxin
MYICICNAITERQIRACAKEGACTVADLEHCLGVGAGCGRCKPMAHELLADNRDQSAILFSAADR